MGGFCRKLDRDAPSADEKSDTRRKNPSLAARNGPRMERNLPTRPNQLIMHRVINYDALRLADQLNLSRSRQVKSFAST